jgi:Type I phosphodiesterase / nucleotide pyrophosphatase
MKLLFFISFFACTINIACAQASAQNIFIITIDGVRWQEIFKGADAALLRDAKFVKDSAIMLQQYWHQDTRESRRRLLPFFWSVVEQQGQLLGNRTLNNKVNVANFYKISYPGYNEIFTGYADKMLIPNIDVYNPNSNILQYLSRQKGFRGKVAAFCYEMADENTPADTLFNNVQGSVAVKNNTRHDLLTFECAKNYIEQHHPKVMYLGLGETDEFAHQGSYDTYLQKLHQADALIAELWYYVQTDPFYKNNTSFIITTDHGRGRKAHNWNAHGFWIGGSGQTWLAMLGNGIAPAGEVDQQQQIYQKQLAATIAALLGMRFIAKHPIAKPIKLLPAEKPAEAGKQILTVKDR